MRSAVVVIIVAIGCGDNQRPGSLPPDDATPDDVPPDPFVGQFDDPTDFPHTDCEPGSLVGFARDELYVEAGLRTQGGNGGLRTFVATYLDEVEVAHVLTADDLFVRHSYWGGSFWTLRAVDVCKVDPDGTIHGRMIECYDTGGFRCDEDTTWPFVAPPFRRIPGESDGDHLTLVGEIGASWPGTSTNVRVDGDLAFVSRFDDGVRIVSISNPAAPREVGHVAMSTDWVNDLEIVHAAGRRYLVTASITTNIFDVTGPANPQLVAQLPRGGHSVFVEDTTLYLVDGTSTRVEVWDLARPDAPRRLGTWMHPGSTTHTFFGAWHDVFVSGGIAYLSDINGSGMHVVDFRDPAHPVVLGAQVAERNALWHSPWLTTVAGRLVAIDGTEFSTPGLRLLDGDPASPTFLDPLGEWSLVRGSTHNLMAIGSIVYAAHYRDGVRVIDIANPAAPQQIAYFNTWVLGAGGAGDLGTFGIDIDPIARRIYLADSIRGLVILQGDATVFP